MVTYIYDDHTKGGWRLGLEIRHEFADSSIFEQNNILWMS